MPALFQAFRHGKLPAGGRILEGRRTRLQERLEKLFEHVVRTVHLIPEGSRPVPLTPYEVYLLGKGTARERAGVAGGAGGSAGGMLSGADGGDCAE
mgnify:CR=1 FL=1